MFFLQGRWMWSVHKTIEKKSLPINLVTEKGRIAEKIQVGEKVWAKYDYKIGIY